MKTHSISEAKRSLGHLADDALRGEAVFIVRKARLLALREFELPEPVPLRPQGYFEDCYDAKEAGESNRLAGHGPRKVVK